MYVGESSKSNILVHEFLKIIVIDHCFKIIILNGKALKNHLQI